MAPLGQVRAMRSELATPWPAKTVTVGGTDNFDQPVPGEEPVPGVELLPTMNWKSEAEMAAGVSPERSMKMPLMPLE